MLIQEIKDGKFIKDKMPNSSYELSEERQAMYFLHVRENMKTDLAHTIMYNDRMTEDYYLLEGLKSGE